MLCSFPLTLLGVATIVASGIAVLAECPIVRILSCFRCLVPRYELSEILFLGLMMTPSVTTPVPMSHPDFGAPRPGREQSPGVLGPSLTHMMNHDTGSNVTSLLYNRSSIQNK
jgi:hypothetical protein